VADKDFVVKNGLVVGDTITVSGVQLDLSNATSGQILKFDGSKFAPASDEVDGQPSVYATTIGDGSSSSYVVTHNLDSRNVVVSVLDAASPYDAIFVRSEATTANTVTLDFSAPVSSNSRRVFISSAGEYDYHSQTIGNGSNSSFEINHGLGSRDVVVTLRNANADYDFVEAATFATSSNKVTLDFSAAPLANSIVASVFLPLEGFSYSKIVGDGSSSVFEINHNLNSRDVAIIVRDTEAPYGFVKPYWEATTANAVSVAFEVAPESSSKEITVFKGVGGKVTPPSFNDITVAAPTTSSSDGQKGDIAYDENYIYICVDENTWKRFSLSTW
jgi:hypothetical protein